MLAKRLPGILPRLTVDEALEATKVHSVAGVLESNQGLLTERPFRRLTTVFLMPGWSGAESECRVPEK